MNNLLSGFFGQKKRARDRYEELDSSAAVAVTLGTQPTLAKRRRTLANEKSVITESHVEKMFNDLVENDDKIRKNCSMINARKRFFKHQFSNLSTQDFDITWKRARQQYFEYQDNKIKNKKDDADDIKVISIDEGDDNFNNCTLADTTIKEGNDVIIGSPEKDDIKTRKSIPCTKISKEERAPDQWSKLFVGKGFRLGDEFTLGESDKGK